MHINLYLRLAYSSFKRLINTNISENTKRLPLMALNRKCFLSIESLCCFNNVITYHTTVLDFKTTVPDLRIL